MNGEARINMTYPIQLENRHVTGDFPPGLHRISLIIICSIKKGFLERQSILNTLLHKSNLYENGCSLTNLMRII